MSKAPSRLGRGLSSLIQPTTAPPREDNNDSARLPSPRPAQGAPTTGKNPSETSLSHGAGITTVSRQDHVQEPGEVFEDAAQAGTISWSLRAVTARIDQISPNAKQPRREFKRETIAQLAASIARNGLVQPLVVRPIRGEGNGSQHYVKYELVAGERRWRASRAAGVEEVPVIIRDVDDEKALELALVENLQREDLNAIDRAEAYARYCREFGLKPEDVAGRLNEDRTTVINYLRILDLPAEVKAMVANGELSMGHARAILGATDSQERVNLAKSAVSNGLSVRALEEIVRRRRDGASPSGPASPFQGTRKRLPVQEMTAQLSHLQNRFQQALGTKVAIRPGRGKGRGKIVIEYYSLDDFDRIMDRLGVQAD